MSIDFSCRAFGKWILTGEHAVLRGCPALVFPIQSRYLELSYAKSSSPLDLRLVGDHGQDLQLLVWGVLEKACELKKVPRSELKGTLLLDSSIPVGAGMGASAALCVALTRWLGFLGYVPENEYYEFSRQLENLFHGESSGVDIAVALSGQGLYFVRDGKREVVDLKWQPLWSISYSGKRGVTLDAVNKVKKYLQDHPEEGRRLDAQMAEATGIALQALSEDRVQGQKTLAKAIELAASCFESWSLNEGEPGQHIQWLREAGALAVKPTGSGGGGYVLALWENKPSVEVSKNLIFC